MATNDDLPPSPAARDAAIARLQDLYAQNHLDVTRFEALVETAERATTTGALSAVFRGLPAPDRALAVRAQQLPAPLGVDVPAIFATLSAVNRRGRFDVPAALVVRARLGSIELDLSDAVFVAEETMLDVRALLGSVTIIVPDGLHVTCEGAATLGSFEHVNQAARSPRDRRRLRITGRALLGSVEIVVKKPNGALEHLGAAVRALLDR